MDRQEISLLSEISQKEKDKCPNCHMIAVIYEIQNMTEMNLSA